MQLRNLSLVAMAVLAVCTAGVSFVSSHREAPFITTQPKVDGTDFYMFNSYESGRSGFVTMIAHYLPLQDAYGGPNYFSLDPNALYEIPIDNNGDASEDVTLQFRFKNTLNNGGNRRCRRVVSPQPCRCSGRLHRLGLRRFIAAPRSTGRGAAGTQGPA